MQGYNPHNVGMFSKVPESIDELIEYIKSQSVYCTMRDGKYIDFKPTAVRDFFSMKKVKGEYFDGRRYTETVFTPEEADLKYLRTFKFEDLTFRGTIEYRSSCTQPIKDVMTVAAFHTGLSGRIGELAQLIKSDRTIYAHGYTAAELQDMLSKRNIPDFIKRSSLLKQLTAILDIASQGHKDRHKNEERLLEPLYEMAQALTNPAKDMVCGLENGISLMKFIEKYSEL